VGKGTNEKAHWRGRGYSMNRLECLLEYFRIQHDKESPRVRGLFKILNRCIRGQLYRRLQDVLKSQVTHLFPLCNASRTHSDDCVTLRTFPVNFIDWVFSHNRPGRSSPSSPPPSLHPPVPTPPPFFLSTVYRPSISLQSRASKASKGRQTAAKRCPTIFEGNSSPM
jgi:hypothetical protein